VPFSLAGVVGNGATFKNTLQISMGRLSRIFRILINENEVINWFIKASHKILNSHWSAVIEEPVWKPYEG
jgi:hypothetical protein